MDVYLFYFFGGRSRRNDFGQGRRNKEEGMRKVGFYSFTLLPLYPFTFLRISKLLRGRCCGQACIDVLFVSPLLMCRF